MLNFNDIIKESKQMLFRFGQKSQKKNKMQQAREWGKGQKQQVESLLGHVKKL